MTLLAEKKERIQAVDALRGFAVMGIMLLHNIEHFNYYSFPPTPSPLIGAIDRSIWDMLFFTFSGKAYAIFALLFGFTFYLQSYSAAKRGEDFKYRYMWRLVLLFGFGCINASFFPGEILVLYSILGFVLVPVRHWHNKALFILALVLMLQPLEWAKVLFALLHPEANPQQMIYSLGDVYPQLGGKSLTEMMKANLITGQLASLNWAWCYGRVFQTASLFMLGMLLGRRGMMKQSAESMTFWTKTLCLFLPSTILMYYFKELLFPLIEHPFMRETFRTILNSWYNLFFMFSMVAAFLLLYWTNKGKVQKILAPYGRMSLTDYIMQSIIGTYLYFGYGLALHEKCGTTYSFLIGVVFLVAQIAFAHWWFRHFKRGPLETIWHKATWIRLKPKK